MDIGTWGVLGLLAGASLYAYDVLKRVTRAKRPPTLVECMRRPSLAAALALGFSGVCWIFAEPGPDHWLLPDWLFCLVAPIWVGWCIGVVGACLLARLWYRRVPSSG